MSLVKLTLNRDHVHVTREGPSFGFVKDKPTAVPTRYLAELMAIGAVAVEEDAAAGAQALEDIAREKAADADRLAKIKEVIVRMAERNHSGDFTAGGKPSKKRVETLVGSEVSDAEIAVAFAAAKAGIQ
jgi:hypothetical protein